MVEVKDQDMGEGMQCITHPYTKNPGGICALCLQEKLGKLVTSSFPLPKSTQQLSPSSSFSSSSTTSLALSNGKDSTNNNNNLPFLLAKKKKDMLAAAASSSSSSSSSSSASANLVYKRSKSTAYGESFSQRKRSGFWSFLHLYSSKHQIATTTKKVDNFSHSRARNQIENKGQRTEKTESKRVVGGGIDVIVEEDESPEKVVAETPTNGSVGGSSFGRKVLRSRSVGCGSRSFSGDFFERIGFGDCALRRIESQREHHNNNNNTKVVSSTNGNGEAMSDIVKCGGIFGGFMIMTSSSSSTTSSSASSTVDHHHQHHHNHSHKMGSRSWGWAFASPMRSKSNSHRGRTITESSSDKNTSQNLDSIPSLVAMRS